MHPRCCASLDPRRVDVVAGDLPAGLAEGERDGAADQPEADDVGHPPLSHGAAAYRWSDRVVQAKTRFGTAGLRRLRRPQRRGAGAWPVVHLDCRQAPASPGPEAAVAQRADARAHQPRHGMADRLAHPPHLAVATLVDRDAQHAGTGLGDVGRGRESIVQLDALAQPADRAGADRTAVVATVARYSFSTPWLGWASRLASSPSLVSSSSPSVSTSRRPTGKTRGSAGTSCTTVRRPCGSAAVVTTPAGLLRR